MDGDQNARTDVFVVSAPTGSVELASVGAGGAADDAAFAPALSDDGRVVVWASRATTLVPGAPVGLAQVYARDRSTGTTTLVSTGATGRGNGESGLNGLAVSGDGGRVAFTSDATNLVAADANGARDVFVRDVTTGTTSLVSVHSSGHQGSVDSGYIRLDISADGRIVSFHSLAPNLVLGDSNRALDVFVRVLS